MTQRALILFFYYYIIYRRIKRRYVLGIIDYVFIVLGLILVLAGIAGCFLPVIPGPPLSFAGILLLHFSAAAEFSLLFLITFGILALLASLLDNILPALGTQRFGGSRRGVWGAAAGLIIGLFFPPFGIIIGAFLGAFILELTTGMQVKTALKSSFGSFAGFLSGIALKLAVSGAMLFYYIYALIKGNPPSAI